MADRIEERQVLIAFQDGIDSVQTNSVRGRRLWNRARRAVTPESTTWNPAEQRQQLPELQSDSVVENGIIRIAKPLTTPYKR